MILRVTSRLFFEVLAAAGGLAACGLGAREVIKRRQAAGALEDEGGVPRLPGDQHLNGVEWSCNSPFFLLILPFWIRIKDKGIMDELWSFENALDFRRSPFSA